MGMITTEELDSMESLLKDAINQHGLDNNYAADWCLEYGSKSISEIRRLRNRDYTADIAYNLLKAASESDKERLLENIERMIEHQNRQLAEIKSLREALKWTKGILDTYIEAEKNGPK